MKIFVVILLVISYSEAYSYYPWMYYLPYGSTVTMKPLFKNESTSVSINNCKWITPSRVELFGELNNFDFNKFRIDKFTCELTIYDIQKENNGVYHCIINNEHVSKAMLNVHGAPKSSLYEEFKPNIIAGFSAAAGILGFFAITCGVFKYRYKKPESRDDKRIANDIDENKNCYTNSSFEHENSAEKATINNDEENSLGEMRF